MPEFCSLCSTRLTFKQTCRNWEPFRGIARMVYEDTENNMVHLADGEAYSAAVAKLDASAVRVLVMGFLQLLVQLQAGCEDASRLLMLTAQASCFLAHDGHAC